jgi:hypothetical protein
MGRNQRVWQGSILSRHLMDASSDTKIPGEIGVHVSFGESDNSGCEFDKRQAALPHEIVNGPYADVQAPCDLRLGFVVRQ